MKSASVVVGVLDEIRKSVSSASLSTLQDSDYAKNGSFGDASLPVDPEMFK